MRILAKCVFIYLYYILYIYIHDITLLVCGVIHSDRHHTHYSICEQLTLVNMPFYYLLLVDIISEETYVQLFHASARQK